VPLEPLTSTHHTLVEVELSLAEQGSWVIQLATSSNPHLPGSWLHDQAKWCAKTPLILPKGSHRSERIRKLHNPQPFLQLPCKMSYQVRCLHSACAAHPNDCTHT
jgi:hypothetical protein